MRDDNFHVWQQGESTSMWWHPYSTQKYYVDHMPRNTNQNFVKIGFIYFTSPTLVEWVTVRLDYVLKVMDTIH